MADIMNSYSVFFDIDEEIEKMEEYYDGWKKSGWETGS